IEQNRVAIILSKDISRIEFLSKKAFSYLIITSIYSIVICSLFVILFFVKSDFLFLHFLISIVLTPLFIVPIIIYVLFFGIYTKSYGLTVFFIFLFGLVLSPIFHLSNTDLFINENSLSFLSSLGTLALYILPDVYGAMDSLANLEANTSLFLRIVFSMIPLSLLTIYIFNNRDL